MRPASSPRQELPAPGHRTTRHLIVTLIGLGNLGSALVPLLARDARLTTLVLVDDDTYDAANLDTQNILAEDLGRCKTHVARARARAIRPDLEVRAYARRVEHVPLGRLRSEVLISCVDSKRSRLSIHEIATRLGVELWIDLGVRPDAQLARVDVVTPDPDHACLECSWCERDYATLETRALCGGVERARPTGGSAALGALGASLGMLALEGWLDEGRPRVSRHEFLVDARGNTACSTAHPRRASCRFDHSRWTIEERDAATTLRDLASSLVAPRPFDPARAVLRMLGRVLVSRTVCPRCERADPVLSTLDRIAGLDVCADCGAQRIADAVACGEELSLDATPSLDVPLLAGLETGDVLSLETPEGTRHVELVTSAGPGSRERRDIAEAHRGAAREELP